MKYSGLFLDMYESSGTFKSLFICFLISCLSILVQKSIKIVEVCSLTSGFWKKIASQVSVSSVVILFP